ncbi:eukaryotic translation initiation factor 5B-like [Stegodyphus dumicola]|uniref:eukaryotic translation initiation factor 5B-like n=1 Tax=Stegodyphus dumicola TaxID=202533 RepID=UPI0015A846B1|nr:eukaryotic translation initiation factor 5B-like [Stegodyphus dumicola]
MGKDKKQKKNPQEEKEKSDLKKDALDLPDLAESKDHQEDTGHSKRSKKAKDKKKSFSPPLLENFSDEEIEIITLEQQRKNKKKLPKASFNILEVEDFETKDNSEDEDSLRTKIQDSSEAVENTAEEKNKSKSDAKAGKKSKKRERKKKGDDDDDDEIQKMLEELAIENKIKQPEDKVKDTVAVVPDAKPEAADNVSEKQSKKKNKEPAAKDETIKEPTAKDKNEPSELSTVKTAAQKKKEKKEREKEKKAAQFEKNAAKKKPDSSEQKVSPPPTTPQTEDTASVLEKDDNEEEEVEVKKKETKGKKKKGEEDDKKDKKRPGKKQIAAMQEALRKVKEEEERLRLEEEARIRAAEEAERLRQEKLRLEQEKKEKKKKKEKERRERLKAEGKLLTKTQKQNRARMEATLAVLRQQGVEIPEVGEKKEKLPRLGDRKKFQKKEKKVQDETSTEMPKIEELPSPEVHESSPEIEEPAEEKAESPIDEDENIKDAWYETSDEESSEEQGLADKKSEQQVADLTSKNFKKHSESEGSSSESENASSDESDSEDESDSSSSSEISQTEKIRMRIEKRRQLAENNRSISKLRSPVVCVLGHVDTGKTKILDKIRSTHVQDSEAGGITQQIGATMVPREALQQQCKSVKNFSDLELKVPGLLIIDTPGHESFSNLRSRGSSLCDIAILVVDITHGLEPQTIESINILKQRKTPFIVALNKVDRLYEWKSKPHSDIQDLIKSQSRSTKQLFDDRVKQIILEFALQSLNAVLYYENQDPRSYISMVPTSAVTGDGMGNLMSLIVEYTQNMMAKRLMFSEELQATVLEIKSIGGLGHTMDVILVNGRLREGDTIVFAGYDGPVSSQIRSLLTPQPLKELRIKTQYIEHREIEGALGVKICGKDFEKAIAGLPLLVPKRSDETKVLMEEIAALLKDAMNSIKVTAVGVYVQTSTLGSLEALMEFLTESKIPVSGVRIGPVTKKDVMKASAMLEHDPTYAVILAFDVKIEKEAQELAESLSIKIFHANIIYHLFDMFTNYQAELKERNRNLYKNEAVFPCKLKILPQFVFNSRDPIVVGVSIEAGILKEGTPLCVPSKEFLEIGTVTTIEVNHKQIETARKGQEVCIKIEPSGGEAPKMYGRHFDHTDLLVSKISRRSIDMCKEHFRDDLLKTDWQLIVELKKLFQIL